jgi:hypothetical protein
MAHVVDIIVGVQRLLHRHRLLRQGERVVACSTSVLESVLSCALGSSLRLVGIVCSERVLGFGLLLLEIVFSDHVLIRRDLLSLLSLEVVALRQKGVLVQFYMLNVCLFPSQA